MSTVTVLVCDSEARANDARSFLIAGEYESVAVLHGQSVSYDAQKYVGVDGQPEGHKIDLLFAAWVVVGRKS